MKLWVRTHFETESPTIGNSGQAAGVSAPLANKIMIHALPGMGADHRMYPAPWTSIPDLVTHDCKNIPGT